MLKKPTLVRTISIVAVLLALIAAGAFAAIYKYATQTTLPQGLAIANWNVQGLSVAEFRQQLDEQLRRIGQQSVAITSKQPVKREKRYTLRDFGIKFNDAEIVSAIERLEQGNVLERAQYRWSMEKQLPLHISLDAEAIRKTVGAGWADVERQKPVNAKRTITADDKVTYAPHKDAYRIDFKKLNEAITKMTPAQFVLGADASMPDGVSGTGGVSGTSGAASGTDAQAVSGGKADTGNNGSSGSDGNTSPGITLELPFAEIHPELTLEKLKGQGVERKIIEFSTALSGSASGRLYNIASTAKVTNDMVLAPGDIFDYAKVIKETEKKFGFKEAPVIMNGKLVPGIGGGICQVSSTIYNAALRTGLEIVERRNHSLPISYLPMGQDATFADDYINFRFKNTTGYFIVMRTTTENHKLTVKFFGTMPDNVAYTIKSQTIKKIEAPVKYVKNSSLAVGEQEVLQRGKAGYVVETYRSKLVDGKSVEKKLISRDYYRAQPKLVAVNSGSEGLSSEKLKQNVIEDGVGGPNY